MAWDDVNAGPCFRCKADITLPRALYDAARKSSRISFWCPYGHEQHYVEGETEAEKLRRERDLLAQRIAQRDDEIARQRELRHQTELRLNATRGVVTRIKNRIGRGVCPCCNRTFENLHRHMATKHPTFTAEAAE